MDTDTNERHGPCHWGSCLSVPVSLPGYSRHIPRQVQAVVEMIQDEQSPLTSLSLADSRLRHETCIVVNALGSAHRLEVGFSVLVKSDASS